MRNSLTRLTTLQPTDLKERHNLLDVLLICPFIFMGYGLGLGLESQVEPAKFSLIAIIIRFAQVIFSHFWIKYFRFGQME